MSRAQFSRIIRRRLSSHLVDDSGASPSGVAIYTLADPRDLRAIRYVGMTDGPRRRLSQHVNTARLWMPDTLPWWVKSAKLRPLYEWIRALHRDGARLPVMVITSWAETLPAARAAERSLIFECVSRGLPVLNIEGEREQRAGRTPLL